MNNKLCNKTLFEGQASPVEDGCGAAGDRERREPHPVVLRELEVADGGLCAVLHHDGGPAHGKNEVREAGASAGAYVEFWFRPPEGRGMHSVNIPPY